MARWMRDGLECERATGEALVAGLLHAFGGTVRLDKLQCLAEAQHAVDEFTRPGMAWLDEDDPTLEFLPDALAECGVERDGSLLVVPRGLGPALALFARRLADRGDVRRDVIAAWRDLLEKPRRGAGDHAGSRTS